MDLNNLQAFTSVAEQGSFSRAAEELFLTQPAISKRVAALEDELETRLFDRIGHNITLTEAGQTLLPRAKRILSEVEDSRQTVINLSGKITGKLPIGTSHHIGLHRLPPVLSLYARQHPQVQLDIHFEDSEEVCTHVEHGKLELGIVTLPVNPGPSLKTTPIWNDPLRIVVSREHPLFWKKTHDLAKLAEHNAILPPTGTFTREILEQVFQPLGIQLKVGLSTHYLETIKMMVSIGLGWSILPLSMIDRDLHVLKVKGINLNRTLGCVQHTERTLSNAAQALLKTLQQYADVS